MELFDSVWPTFPVSTNALLCVLYASGALNWKFIIERFMKDSESCTLHTEESTSSRYIFRETFHGWHMGWKIVLRETVSLPRPPEASYRLHSGGTPCNNLNNLLVDLSVTQFWFDGGFPDSPELSKNLNTINLALGRSSSSALRISHCDAFMSANIWCLKNIPPPFASSLTEPHFL